MGADAIVSDGPKMKSIMPDWWKWVVLLATFYMSLIVNGYTYCFGLLKIRLKVDYPDTPDMALACIGGLVPSLFLFLAPFGIAINEFFGSRAVTIAGSLMSSICFVLVWMNGAFFGLGYFFDLIFLGIGQGVSFALLYGPSVAVLPSYFGLDQLSLATGITNAGASVGVMIYGFISYPIFEYFGWRGAMLCYSALSLHGVLAGLAFAKMVPVKEAPNVGDAIQMEEKPNGDPTKEALLPAAPQAVEAVQPPKRTFFTVLKKYFDVKLICQGPFILLLGSAAFSITGYFVPTVLIPTEAKVPAYGVHPFIQKNIMVVFGVSNLIGRVGSGFLGDYALKTIFCTSFTFYVGGLTLAATACLIFPHVMMLGDVAFLIFVMIYGLSVAPIITMRSLLTINMFGKKNANASFGWFLSAQGAIQMLGYILPARLAELGDVYAYLFAAGMFLAAAACCASTFRLFFSERRKMIEALKTSSGQTHH